MAYYRICPYCGDALDPDEKCDCQEEKQQDQEFFTRHLKTDPISGQLTFKFVCSGEGRYESKSYC